jgi:hypothetical protein
MKKYLLPFLLFAIPSPAIAIEPLNYPANFIEWRGVVYSLDHLAGKGEQVIITTQEQKPVEKGAKPFNANMERVKFENARNLIRLEYLQNMR